MYELLTDLNVLHEAYVRCKKGVEWKESVQRYGMNELINIAELSERLKSRTYRQKPFFAGKASRGNAGSFGSSGILFLRGA